MVITLFSLVQEKRLLFIVKSYKEALRSRCSVHCLHSLHYWFQFAFTSRGLLIISVTKKYQVEGTGVLSIIMRYSDLSVEDTRFSHVIKGYRGASY